jgi:hypothetical protein
LAETGSITTARWVASAFDNRFRAHVRCQPSYDRSETRWGFSSRTDREQDESDDEPSLGTHEIRPAGAVSYLCHPIHTYDATYYDGEEACDDEGCVA